MAALITRKTSTLVTDKPTTLLAMLIFSGVSLSAYAGVNDNYLATGETLQRGQQIQSQSGEFALQLHLNGVLALSRVNSNGANTFIWKSNPTSQNGRVVTLEESGNLTIRSLQGTRLWGSETGGSKADRLVLNDKGELALLTGERVIWSPTGFSGVDGNNSGGGNNSGNGNNSGGGNNAGGGSQNAPNIVLILADDLPWYGTAVRMEEGNNGAATSYQDMPTLQQLANQGVTFSHAYATSSICGPSRANIQLGTTPVRSRYTANSGTGTGDQTAGMNPGANSELMNEPRSRIHLPDTATTFAERLKSMGYKTAHFGKWHVYGGGPQYHGYDESDGETNNDQGNPDRYGNGDPKGMFSITQRANSFVRRAVAEKSPFYVQLSHYVAHKRYQARPQTIQKYMQRLRNGLANKLGLNQGKSLETYATQLAMMEDFDTSINQLLSNLRELGVEQNTYIVFSADNGYQWETTTNNLRGGKWWLFEAGIRVPLIIKGPNVRQGGRSLVNVSHHDFYPTFIDWAGGRVDSLTDIDGVSLKNHLVAPERIPSFSARNIYFHYPHYRESTPQSAVINDRYKLLMFYDHMLTGNSDASGLYLFNLGHAGNNYATQNEANNLAPSQLTTARQMQQEFMSYVREASDWPEFALPTRNANAVNARPINIESRFPPIRR